MRGYFHSHLQYELWIWNIDRGSFAFSILCQHCALWLPILIIVREFRNFFQPLSDGCVCTNPLRFGKGWWLVNAAQRVYELTGCYSNHGAWSYLSVLLAAMISRAAFPRRVCVLSESEAHSSIHGAGFTVATELGSCHRAQLHSWSATMQEGRRLRQTNYVKTASIEPLCLTQVWVCVKVLLC